MKASMSKTIQDVLSQSENARRLTAAIIRDYNKDIITVNDVLPGKVLTLKRVKLKTR